MHSNAGRPGASTRIRWFKNWNGHLDRALSVLPETECCPHDLYRRLALNSSSSRKDFAVVEDEHGDPLGVVCLRRREALGDWAPLTHYTLPGLVFPVREGCLARVLSVLNRNVRLVCWRMGEFTDEVGGLRTREVKPTFSVDLKSDFQRFWHKQGHLKEVKKQRERCRDFSIAVNRDGMAEWVVRNWELKWREQPDVERIDLEDKLLAIDYLHRLEKNVTFTLHEPTHDTPIVGFTFILQGRTLVGQYTYRAPGYEKLGIGTYVLDFAINWALEHGLEEVDLGGDYPEHKKRWGPPTGSKTSMHVCPPYQVVVDRSREAVRFVRRHGLRRSWLAGAAKFVALLEFF